MSQVKEKLKKENEKERKREFDARGFWVRLWKLLTPSHRQIMILLVLTLFVQLVNLAGPYVLKLIIDKITNFNPEEIKQILILIAAMFLLNQSMSVLSYFEDKKIFSALVNMVAYLSCNAHEKMVGLGLSYHEKENTGNKIVKIQRGIDRIDFLFGNFFWDVAPTVFQIILTTIVLFVMSWRFGVIILFFVPLFIFLTLKANRRVFPYRKERYDQEEKAAGLMAQSIININTVKSFVQEQREKKQYGQIICKVQDSIKFEFAHILNFNLKRNLVIDAGRIAIMLLGVYWVYKGNMTIGSLVFIYTISEKALISLFRISRLYDRIMESAEAVDRLYDLGLVEEKIKNNPNGLKPKEIEGRIEFENVDFSYSESKNKALSGVNFKINSGCVTALVGPSGGGKTTIARMVYRHYDPDKGAVLLDDKDLRDYDIHAFRHFMAIVPQEVEIFNASVRDNISYAKPNATFTEIKAAARIANAEEFISQLQNGYDTLVGERGIKLSGGQRQRVGIARAILANPRILIFDEATSNLDSYSERLIQDAMDKIRKGRTVIIIAHRLSTIKKADKIVVLEKGKVMEEGSHFELAKVSGGLYQKLLKLQEMGDVE